MNWQGALANVLAGADLEKAYTFTMHPLSYTTLMAIQSHRYVSNGPCGLVKHRTRRKAMRMTGRGSCWIVSPKGRVLARNHSPFVTPTQ